MTCYDAILTVDYESDGVITVPCPVGTRGQARSVPCISWEAPANGRLDLLAHSLYFCARKAWKRGCFVARRPPPSRAVRFFACECPLCSIWLVVPLELTYNLKNSLCNVSKEPNLKRLLSIHRCLQKSKESIPSSRPWRTTPCLLSTTAYSVYLRNYLPTIWELAMLSW